ncbi:hypothetical protein TRVL_06457 [Trypanosoma vivax]|nr:hypothetical protein TRVL_06457 [Trypanosoma vivax]
MAHTATAHCVTRRCFAAQNCRLVKLTLQMCPIPAGSGAKLTYARNDVLSSVFYIARCFHPFIHLLYAVSSENCQHEILVSCPTLLYHFRNPLLEQVWICTYSCELGQREL